MNPIRILLADDHVLIRAGIRALLQNIPGIQVVAEAEDGVEALELVAQHRPEVVLMDITMPEVSGLEACARIVKEFPNVRVIILSMHQDEEYVLQALRAGAVGYLLKGAQTVELELAVKAVTRGETYLTPKVSKHVVGSVVHGENGSPRDRLTPRQRQILQLIAEGNSRKQISQRLNISVKTVDTYRAQVMEQLDIHDSAGLVRYAVGMGLVKPVK